jgi:hypothetical protein
VLRLDRHLPLGQAEIHAKRLPAALRHRLLGVARVCRSSPYVYFYSGDSVIPEYVRDSRRDPVHARLGVAKLGNESQFTIPVFAPAAETLPFSHKNGLFVFAKLATVIPIYRPEVYKCLPAFRLI